MEHFDLTERNLITGEVEVDLDVLRALMLHWLAGHVYNTDVVTENHCGLSKWGMQLQQELPEPGSLSHGIGNRTVLSLSTGAGDCRLLLGGPGDQVGTEEHRISRCGLAGFGATGPVSIRVDCQLLNTGSVQL
jgi:hypothetical protein